MVLVALKFDIIVQSLHKDVVELNVQEFGLVAWEGKLEVLDKVIGHLAFSLVNNSKGENLESIMSA